MISDRLIHLQASRMFLINFSFCSPCNWNLQQKRMKASEPFHFWNWWLVMGGASLYTCTVLYRLYTNAYVVFGEGMEDEKVYLVSKSGKLILASLIYLSIDALACIFIVNMIGIAIMLSERRQLFWRVNNAVIDLNDWMMQKLEEHNGYQSPGQDASGRKAEVILFMLNIGSVVLPIFYGLAVLHEYEPVHRSLEEWLEMKPELNLSFLPLMLMVDWGLLFCGNCAYLPLCMGLLYIELCQFWIPGLTPRTTILFQGKPRYSTNLGIIDESTIIKFYRCQQVINVVINDILKSGWASLHHATILIVFVLATFICINYSEDVSAMQVAGLILPAAAFCSMLIEYYETHLLGKILWESRQFIKAGKKVSIPGSRLRRFFLSCSDIKMQTAHPFFVVSYDTFLLILHQGIDFLVSMLVLD